MDVTRKSARKWIDSLSLRVQQALFAAATYLILLAIFLPVAASGRLAQDAPSSVVPFDFVVIGVLVLIVGIVMAIFTVIGKYKERKFYEHHHRNP